MFDTTSDIIKAVFSMVMLISCIALITALIMRKETTLAAGIGPVGTIIFLWFNLIFCSLFEGGQASLVGLKTVDRGLFKESHTISHMLCKYINKGNNLDRYLMGRQYWVIIIVFLISLAGQNSPGTYIPGVPDIITDSFLSSGVACILLTAMVGQLNTQVNSARCMLDFINTHFITLSVYLSMVMEASGLLHVTYLFQMAFAKILDEPIESNEAPMNTYEKVLFWGRSIFSTGVLIFCCLVNGIAILEGKTTMWEGVPVWASFVIFFVLMIILGFLESIQISFYYVSKLTEEERNVNIWSKLTCDILFKGDGKNLPRFLIGRQLFVVTCFFILARIQTIVVPEGESNILGVSDWMQQVFNSGQLGSYITTICGALIWRLAASAFPMVFMKIPITYILLRMCLFFECTGVCSGAWVLAAVCRKIMGYKLDEEHIGTAEERKMKVTRRNMRRMSTGVTTASEWSTSGSDEDCSLSAPLLPESDGELDI